jgi:hypothetical protein
METEGRRLCSLYSKDLYKVIKHPCFLLLVSALYLHGSSFEDWAPVKSSIICVWGILGDRSYFPQETDEVSQSEGIHGLRNAQSLIHLLVFWLVLDYLLCCIHHKGFDTGNLGSLWPSFFWKTWHSLSSWPSKKYQKLFQELVALRSKERLLSRA